jgi:prolyl-tRNA synthetase
VTLARRDVPGRNGKHSLGLDGLVAGVQETLDKIQAGLYSRALAFREEHTYEPEDYGEFKEAVSMGFAYSWWCGDAGCEAKIKDDTKATIRCIPFEDFRGGSDGTGTCVRCGQEARERVIFARAY